MGVMLVIAGAAMLWLASFVFGIATGHTPRESAIASSGVLGFLVLLLAAFVLFGLGIGATA